MKRREHPNQLLIDWTTRVAEPSPTSPTKRKRIRTPARLPVPEPLPQAVNKGNFGIDSETDDPIRPKPAEVRAITENHAERMIELLHQLAAVSHLRTPEGFRKKDLLEGEYKSKLTMYAEDFGEEAAARLDSYVRHQIEGDHRSR